MFISRRVGLKSRKGAISKRGSGSRSASGNLFSVSLVSAILMSQLYAGPAMAATTLSVKWKEQDGNILLATVCYSHRYGSIAYRNCRADAQKQFKGRCAYFTRQLEYATGSQRSEYKKGEKKYCYAARTLRIVN